MSSAEVQFADTHIGSMLGLCPPKALLDLGDTYSPNHYQKWMWKCWENVWKWVDQVTDGVQYKHLSIVGDVADIDAKGRSNQIWGCNVADVVEAADIILDPIISQFDDVHFIRGTEAHGGKGNEVEELIARNYDNSVRHPISKRASWWSRDISVGGVVFNLAHHGRKGYKPWTKHNPLEALKNEVILQRVSENGKIPDIITRGHFHQFAMTPEYEKPIVVNLPGWQYKTAYVHRIDATDGMPQVGVVVYLCDKGDATIMPKVYKAKRRIAWRPKSV